MSKYINPFTDWGFKYLFGQEVNKDQLIDFLNGLLQEERHIVDVTFGKNDQLPEAPNDRTIIYDIHCTTDNGEKIIVEMQNKETPNFIDRTLYYLSRSVIEQGKRGNDWDYEFAAVYGVFFMNFAPDILDERIRVDAGIQDRETGKTICDKMRFIYLQLPYFNKTEQECETTFDKWIYVLKHMEALDRMPFTKSKVFLRLEKIAEKGALTPEQRIAYEASEKRYRDTYGAFVVEHQKGVAEGIVKGRAEGRAEGERENSLNIARKLLSMGMDIPFIAEATKLSPEEIAKL